MFDHFIHTFIQQILAFLPFLTSSLHWKPSSQPFPLLLTWLLFVCGALLAPMYLGSCSVEQGGLISCYTIGECNTPPPAKLIAYSSSARGGASHASPLFLMKCWLSCKSFAGNLGCSELMSKWLCYHQRTSSGCSSPHH